jgi:hypothetical protein
MEDRTLLSIFVVKSTADSGPGSLRQAILDSNKTTGGTNTIAFKIPGHGVQVIAPASPLPAITRAVVIDGLSQPGYAGTPLIELSGSQAGTGDGLTVTGPKVTVRGLDVNNFGQGAGVHITGTGATGDWIYGNSLGTDPTGTQAAANNEGVEIDAGATKNLVGTNGDGVNDAAERNLLSGNLFAGVWITGQGTSNNAVAGNFIGTDISGTIALNNGTQTVTDSQGNVFGGGVAISAGASNNRIGTDGKSIDDIGERNVIAGSNNDAIDIYGTGTDGNIAAGNFIGIDVSGTRSLGVAGNGVSLAEGASSNWIGVNPYGGMLVAHEGNVISGNGADGVVIYAGANSNVVAGNRIGTDGSGLSPLPNTRNGVEIWGGSSNNTVGGTVAAAANLISDNGGVGVAIEGSSVGDAVLENSIFANTGQAIDLGNDGVTYNAASPRQGPNNLQNFPILFATTDGQLRGGLWGSSPDTTFHIDVFASAAYNSDGSGEAQDYLGSLQATTDSQGQVTFSVPFSPPDGLPVITATATDPQGNTSEVSALRRSTVQAPSGVYLVPGHSLTFSATAGDTIAMQDPDASPLDPTWDVTLSVTSGTLALASTAGLIGSGDGTGTLNYRGTLPALNAALEGMVYTPPQAPHVLATLSLEALSPGASPLQAQVIITDGFVTVTTTADSGPGSLRQAILDSNAAAGPANTIDFDILGQGVQTIALSSSLPAITNPVLIDGESQPGYSGTPLIEINGSQAGSGDGLLITAPNVTVRGLDIGGFASGAAIHITGASAAGNWIYGNFLGTDPTGTQAVPNNTGVKIDAGASNNLIGTNGDGVNDTAERNLLSGNFFAGVWITGQGTDGNAVAGNFIGTDTSATRARKRRRTQPQL